MSTFHPHPAAPASGRVLVWDGARAQLGKLWGRVHFAHDCSGNQGQSRQRGLGASTGQGPPCNTPSTTGSWSGQCCRGGTSTWARGQQWDRDWPWNGDRNGDWPWDGDPNFPGWRNMLSLGLSLGLFLAQCSSLAARSLLPLAAAVPLGRQWGPGKSPAGRTALPRGGGRQGANYGMLYFLSRQLGKVLPAARLCLCLCLCFFGLPRDRRWGGGHALTPAGGSRGARPRHSSATHPRVPGGCGGGTGTRSCRGQPGLGAGDRPEGGPGMV